MFQGIDRFLASILVVIFFVVLLAVVLVWRSPTTGELEYKVESNPSDVVHNFVVAVTRGDEERAKSYLSPELLEEIAEREKEDRYSIIRSYGSGSGTGLRIVVEDETTVEGLATVELSITWFHSEPTPLGLLGMFGSNQYSRDFDIRLRQFDGEWKIVEPFDLYML